MLTNVTDCSIVYYAITYCELYQLREESVVTNSKPHKRQLILCTTQHSLFLGVCKQLTIAYTQLSVKATKGCCYAKKHTQKCLALVKAFFFSKISGKLLW